VASPSQSFPFRPQTALAFVRAKATRKEIEVIRVADFYPSPVCKGVTLVSTICFCHFCRHRLLMAGFRAG